MVNFEFFFVSFKVMNLVLIFFGVEFFKGFLGIKLLLKSRFYVFYGYSVKIFDIRKYYFLIFCFGGVFGCGVVVVVGKEIKVGKVDVEEFNGFSNGVVVVNGVVNRVL